MVYGANNQVPPQVVAPIQIPVAAHQPKNATILFAFDRHDPAAIDQGFSSVDTIAQQIRADNPARVEVSGYADRFGSVSYNHQLSANRSNTVAELLVQRGVNPQIISVSASGQTSMYKQCEGAKSNTVVNCLAPNRRVNVSW